MADDLKHSGQQLWLQELPSLTQEPFNVFLSSGIKLLFDRLLGFDDSSMLCVNAEGHRQLIRYTAVATVTPARKASTQG